MGITFITEVIGASIEDSEVLPFIELLPDIVNMSVGIIIFVLLVCNKKTKNALQAKFRPQSTDRGRNTGERNETETVLDISSTSRPQQDDSLSHSAT